MKKQNSNENTEKKNHINRNQIKALKSISATNQKRIVSHPLADIDENKLSWETLSCWVIVQIDIYIYQNVQNGKSVLIEKKSWKI